MKAYGDQRQHMCHMPVLFEPSIEIMSAGNIWRFSVNSKIQSSNLTFSISKILHNFRNRFEDTLRYDNYYI